ncbi:MAG TPA: hypothetical protein VF529_09175 [Solirubrobacteraceae bacterium]|jgi:hypothetical protein
MPAIRLAAVVLTAASLAAPAAASGHAWSDTRTLTTDGALPTSDMSRSGHGIVAWVSADDGTFAAIAPPGGGFGPAEGIASLDRPIHDVAIAENGDAFALWFGSTGSVFVARRHAGGTWSAGEQLVGAEGPADLVAGPEGDVTVVTGGDPGLRIYQREAGDNTFTAGATGTIDFEPFLHAGYVGDRVAIIGQALGAELHAVTLQADGTLGAPYLVDDELGPQSRRLATDEGGAGAVFTWPVSSPSHMRAATAGPDGTFGAGQKVSGDLYKGVMIPAGAIATDGRVLVGWGDAEFDPVTLVEAASPGGAFGPIAAPAVPGNRTDDLHLAFDSRGAALAAWYFSDNAANGTTGRIEVAMRLPGQSAWCGAETLATHRANGYTLSVETDGNGRGFATWQTPAGGPDGTASVWVSRYAAKDDCPPTPPPPPPEEVQREEVTYLPPPAPPPVVTVVRRFVQLTAPRTATVDRRGRVRLPVTCSGDAPACAGKLALKRGRSVWASRSFAVPKGRRALRVQLRAKARRALARRRRAKVVLELRLQGQSVKRSALTLRRR